MQKKKMIIAGIGGVGGYFGGLLAKHFYEHDQVEINFLARGQHLKEIQEHGLKVIQGDREFIAKPTLATDNASDIGKADFIIIASKSYDLEKIVEQLKPCIHQDTIILPLLNGVDSKERIKKLLPDHIVLDGCVYIVARLKQAGVVENIGNIQTLYFGLDHVTNDRLVLLENLFKEAGIEATLSKNISTLLWEKFIFISPTATATSYFDKCISDVIADKDMETTIMLLIEEVKQIALAKQIVVAEDITEKTQKKLKGFPSGITSSMHSDFQNKKPNNELESLTGYVVNEGKKYEIDTPTYLNAFEALKKKRGLFS